MNCNFRKGEIKTIMHLRKNCNIQYDLPKTPIESTSIPSYYLVLTVSLTCLLAGTLLHIYHAFVPWSFLHFFLPELCSSLTFEFLLHITSSSDPFLDISPNLWNPVTLSTSAQCNSYHKGLPLIRLSISFFFCYDPQYSPELSANLFITNV